MEGVVMTYIMWIIILVFLVSVIKGSDNLLNTNMNEEQKELKKELKK